MKKAMVITIANRTVDLMLVRCDPIVVVVVVAARKYLKWCSSE